MNPKLHVELAALCALYYSGDISEEEWALIQIHMGYCDSCHEKFLEYHQITAEVIPAVAAEAASESHPASWKSPRSFQDAERRLLSRLDSSRRPQGERSAHSRSWLGSPLILAAASILGATSVLGLYLIRVRFHSNVQAVQVVPVSTSASQTTSALSSQDAGQVIEPLKRQVVSFEQQIVAVNRRLKQSNIALGEIEKQLEVEQAFRNELSAEKDVLSRQLTAAHTDLDATRSKEESVGSATNQQAGSVEDLESQVKELKAAVEEKDVALGEKDRMLALDKDFLAHDRDIRDLIGARNLYIADIFDTTDNGKTARQFGRIFYTKDRSLVFYGFDLDSQIGHRRDSSFQVWGSGSDRPTPVSLGLFYEDDMHKRWVLRCNDTKALARLDMVFVTVEPPGGSAKPTGKQFLRAYLQVHPNHP